jgi:hypothetical protein
MKKNLQVLFCGYLIFNIITLTGCSGYLKDEVKKQVWNFEREKAGSLPAGWEAAETNGKGEIATWEIIKDAKAQSGRQSLAIIKTRNSGRTFNLIIAKETNYKDLELTVWVKACSGKEDQGGGPVWRAKDANNYYIARWNPLEKNFRLYFVENSRRQQLASLNVDTDPKAWHKITIRHTAEKIEAILDDKMQLNAADQTFEQAGSIGLWTKADAATAFDSIEVKSLGAD